MFERLPLIKDTDLCLHLSVTNSTGFAPKNDAMRDISLVLSAYSLHSVIK